MNEQTSVSFWDSSVALASDGLAYVTAAFQGLHASWQALPFGSQVLAGLIGLWLLFTTIRSLLQSRHIRHLTTELDSLRSAINPGAPRVDWREGLNQQTEPTTRETKDIRDEDLILIDDLRTGCIYDIPVDHFNTWAEALDANGCINKVWDPKSGADRPPIYVAFDLVEGPHALLNLDRPPARGDRVLWR